MNRNLLRIPRFWPRIWWENWLLKRHICPACYNRGIVVIMPEEAERKTTLSEIFCAGCKERIGFEDLTRVITREEFEEQSAPPEPEPPKEGELFAEIEAERKRVQDIDELPDNRSKSDDFFAELEAYSLKLRTEESKRGQLCECHGAIEPGKLYQKAAGRWLDYRTCASTGVCSNDPFIVWSRACEQANAVVQSWTNFETRGDIAVQAARELLGLALEMRGEKEEPIFDPSEPYTKTCPRCGSEAIKWNYSFSEKYSGTYEFRKDGGCRAEVNPEGKYHVKITCTSCGKHAAGR